MSGRINKSKWLTFSPSISAGMAVKPQQVADLYDLECVDINHRAWNIVLMQLKKLLETAFKNRYGYLPAVCVSDGGLQVATGDQTPDVVGSRTRRAMRSIRKTRTIAIGTAERAEATDNTRRHLHNQANALAQVCSSMSRGDRRLFSSSAAARFAEAEAEMKAKRKPKN